MQLMPIVAFHNLQVDDSALRDFLQDELGGRPGSGGSTS